MGAGEYYPQNWPYFSYWCHVPYSNSLEYYEKIMNGYKSNYSTLSLGNTTKMNEQVKISDLKPGDNFTYCGAKYRIISRDGYKSLIGEDYPFTENVTLVCNLKDRRFCHFDDNTLVTLLPTVLLLKDIPVGSDFKIVTNNVLDYRYYLVEKTSHGNYRCINLDNKTATFSREAFLWGDTRVILLDK
jgi:hypothetical protein